MKCGRPSSLFQALSLSIFLAGCDTAKTPLAPTPAPSAPPPPPVALVTGTLSGMVYEVTISGRVPVADVEVYCDACGPQGHSFSITGSDGEYVFAGAPAGVSLILVAKSGYALPRPDWTNPNPTPLSWLGGMNATVNGDTRFDLELVRR